MTAALNRIDALFEHNARTLPRKAHLIGVSGVAQTYEQTWLRAQRLAGVMVQAGLPPGARVLALMGNSFELVELYVACSLANVICVPVNLMSTGHEVSRIKADCAPDAVVIQNALLDRILPDFGVESLRLRIVTEGSAPGWDAYDEALARATPLAQGRSAARGDPVVMIYSSGTTGKPKGILLGEYALIENARMTLSVMRYQQSDVLLTMLPLFSSFGFSYDFLQVALAGATLVLSPRFDPGPVADLVARHRVTALAGVPTMYARLFEHVASSSADVSSLRLIDVGGGPVSDRLKKELVEDFGIDVVESYGLSEIAPVASVQIPGIEQREGSCGPALPGIEVRVVDGNGRDQPPGEAGELLFRCDTFMVGYWNQPELTAQTLRDGWLHSGDIGIVDERGEIHIRDRIKDIIVSSGNNVYPKEVENAIIEIPAVQSVAVIGVPDEIRGENIHAFVVLRPGQQLDRDTVIAHCAQMIARYKVPREVTFLDELPLTASGKIRRFELRALARERAAQT
ncbi:MAG: AMP-binding protein [Burkholderiales bacterium]